MIPEMQRPTLNKGENYEVILYPGNEIAKAQYLGYSESARQHIFSTQNSGRFLIVNDHWMRKDNKGIITHTPISSVPINSLTKKIIALSNEAAKAELLKMLNEVWVNL